MTGHPMNTRILSRFDPFSMSDDMVRRIATGREDILADVLRVIESNRKAPKGPMQHLAILAPRGTGKTFMFRLIELNLPDVNLPDGNDDGHGVIFLHLPEEMSFLNSPGALLEEIIRRLNAVPADRVVIPMHEAEGAWDRAAAQLDELLAERFGKSRGLLIVGIENFEEVRKDAFRRPEDQRRLRAWLDRPDGRIMLIAASSRGRFDGDPKAPLFGFLRNIELPVWTPDQTVDFLERALLARTGHRLDPRRRARAHAIATFTGGNPRMAVALAEILTTSDSLSAAETLSAMIDDLTDYYRDRLNNLGRQARHCLDAMMRRNEPVSQSELAERLGVRQSDISQAFKEMRQKALLNEERLPGSKERLYSVADRIFVHYYRQRQLRHGELTSLLELIVELLTDLFTPHERADEGEKLYAIGRSADARIMLDTLPRQGPMACEEFWWEGLRDFKEWVDECATRWELPKSGWHDLLSELCTSPRDASALAHKARQQDAPSSPSAEGMRRIVVGLAHLCAGETDAALTQFRHAADSTANDRIAVLAQLGKALTFAFVRQWADAEQASDTTIDQARRTGDAPLLVRALQLSIYCARQTHNPKKAMALREEALALAKATQDHLALARLYGVAFYVDNELGGDVAFQSLRDAYQAATDSGNNAAKSVAAQRLAAMMCNSGQASEALSMSQEAIAAAQHSNDPWLLIWAFVTYSENLQALNRIDEGLNAGREAARIAKDTGSLYLLTFALSSSLSDWDFRASA
jgi:DNA-binding MarR family transcriptional regulator